MAEKSPAVHPTRQRNVLTEARRQVALDVQNWNSSGELTAMSLAHFFSVSLPWGLFWQASRMCGDDGVRLRRTNAAWSICAWSVRHGDKRLMDAACLEIMIAVAAGAVFC
jgi:hypothetical protein